MSEDYSEYIVFTTTSKSGEELEMAVTEEFECGSDHYVAAALVVDDMINEDELYLYRIKKGTQEFVPENITDPEEYDRVVKAYTEMEMTDRF